MLTRDVQTLLNHIEASVRDRGLLRRGASVLVAVSGGVDSMVLLHALHALAARWGWRLVVAHFNHQLRGAASSADERFVVRTAAGLGLKCVVGRASVKAFARTRGHSLEMAARDLRHEFLARTARAERCHKIALAHHADDQVELFFLRVLRSAGSEGLAGMKWNAPSPAGGRLRITRPLLDLRKADLVQWAREQRIRFREDATNESPDILRNRIRRELLPRLRREYQPALDQAVLRIMDLLGAEAEALGDAAEAWLQSGPEARHDVRGKGATEERAGKSSGPRLQDVPVGLQRRIVQRQLHRLGVTASFDLIEALRLRPGAAVCFKPGHTVHCDAAGRVALHRSRPETFREAECVVQLAGKAGEVTFAGRRILWRLVAARGAKLSAAEARQEMFDADQVGSQIRLRHWRAGDRFQPIGMSRALKLQDWFVNQKIPRARRRELLVAEAGNGNLFWIEGQRISETCKLTPQSQHRLVWTCQTTKKL